MPAEPPHRILVVDDDAVIRQLMREVFQPPDYQAAEADSAARARELLARERADLVLLDVGLPGEDGLSLARHIREHLDIPIIMVSGAGEPVDRIIGLEVGADDYVAKPFEPRELLARVRSVLRRYRRGQSPAQSEVGDDRPLAIGRLALDRAARRLLDDAGDEIPLTRMEFDLLLALVDHAGRVLSRDQLLNLTQNRDWTPYDRSIDIRIARLRRKLGRDKAAPELIRTVRGVGYVFEMPPD